MAILYGLALPTASGHRIGEHGFATPKQGAKLLLGHRWEHVVAEGVRFHISGGKVFFQVELPQTELANDIYKLVNLGFLSQCSIGPFIDSKDNDLLAIGELSLVLRPMYPQTWVKAAKTPFGIWGMNTSSQAGTPAQPRERLRDYTKWNVLDRMNRILDLCFTDPTRDRVSDNRALTAACGHLADVMLSAKDLAAKDSGKPPAVRKPPAPVRPAARPLPVHSTRSAALPPIKGSLAMPKGLSPSQVVAWQLFGDQTPEEIRDSQRLQNVNY